MSARPRKQTDRTAWLEVGQECITSRTQEKRRGYKNDGTGMEMQWLGVWTRGI